MKKYGVVGHRGKLGRLLLERPNFVFVDCNITDLSSIERGLGDASELDLLVNCAGMSSIDSCEADFDLAIKINKNGLHNLHKVFGSRVLNISSDQVFSGKGIFLPKENSYRQPINAYGFSKLGAELVSYADLGKTIRLSRTVSLDDPDIERYLYRVLKGETVAVPTFFKRNYLARDQAVDGIEFFVNNYDKMPDIVNYGSLDNVSFYKLVRLLSLCLPECGGDVIPRRVDVGGSPRPKRAGFNVSLAKKLGFPMYTLSDTMSKLEEEL